VTAGIAAVLLAANLVAMAVHWLLLRSRFAEKKILASLRAEVDRLVTDLGREADRDVALLEGRIKALRDLIAEVDSRLLLEKREGERRETSALFEQTLASRNPTPIAPAPDTPPPPERPITVYTKPLITRSERPITPSIPLNERVLDMARKGISAEMIAASLAVSLGEVELIIDMNRSSL